MGADGTQYLSRAGSRKGLTTAMRVPFLRASCRYLVITGWLLATLLPMSTTRSVPMRSLKEQVGAPQPRVALSPLALAAWQRRAHESTLGEPAMRASFWMA